MISPSSLLPFTSVTPRLIYRLRLFTFSHSSSPLLRSPAVTPAAVTPAAVTQATNYYDIPDSDDPACHGAYMEAADVANSALDVELEWMFDRVKWALTLLLRGNVEFPGYLAYPGFHIFLGDERFDGIEVRKRRARPVWGWGRHEDTDVCVV
jgi:hypothetical protein